MGNKLDYRQALIEEIKRVKPKLYTDLELENMSHNELKKILDKICEGRL